MRLWAVYSNEHSEVDVGGDRDGLRGLATALGQGDPVELLLDSPPNLSHGDEHALQSVRVQPVESVDARICFCRDGAILVVSGKRQELARIVAHAVSDVAEGPPTKNGVGSHVHLDPTSDPGRRYYAADSGSLAIAFDETE